MRFEQRLHIDTDYSAFVGNFGVAENHRHGALALLTGLSGDLHIYTPHGVEACRSALIDANELHKVDCGEEHMSTLYIEPDSPAFIWLRDRYLGRDRIAYNILPNRQITSEIEDWVLTGRLDSLLGVEGDFGHTPMDRRILTCIQTMRHERLDREGSGQSRREDHASQHSLSPSRFSHLFTEQAQVSFRRYRLWSQITHFACVTQQMDSMTHAALMAGFSDAAHMNNTFRSFFGFNPLRVLSDLDEFSVDRPGF